MSHHRFNPEHLALTRREFLSRCGMGMGALSLGSLLQQSLAPSSQASTYMNPLAPHGSQFPGTAKRVIHLFMKEKTQNKRCISALDALRSESDRPLIDLIRRRLALPVEKD